LWTPPDVGNVGLPSLITPCLVACSADVVTTAMPDALSKTIPMWCAVMNRAIFPSMPESHDLSTPQQSVSASEHSQMESRVEMFVEQLLSLNPSITEFRDKPSKPLRPFWITRDSELPSAPVAFADCSPIILCTASRRVLGGELSEGGYIQGAGDDSEGWACGLTPTLFWRHRVQLMEASEPELPKVIANLLLESEDSSVISPSLIEPTSWLEVGTVDYLKQLSLATLPFDAVICCSEDSPSLVEHQLRNRYLHIKCGSGKLGSRELRKQLSKIVEFAQRLETTQRILICCSTGKDISLGVSLAMLCLFSDNNGKFTLSAAPNVDKSFIRQRLNWITLSVPTANPSRATLQSVNAFLMGSGP
jgi:tRNA A64-2'-O-ribosylphosphate transferase